MPSEIIQTERLFLPVIPSPVLGRLPDDPAYVRRVRVVHEYVKYLPSYGGVDRVAAPSISPHVYGGVHDVPNRAVVVDGGYLKTPPWYPYYSAPRMLVISVAPNPPGERIYEVPRPTLDIGSPNVSGGVSVYVIFAIGNRQIP